ncbi:unnamed protein product [Coregonus sp. 'balchen']|nr:unnamed protein product [Coregonus sp. 'balchen']
MVTMHRVVVVTMPVQWAEVEVAQNVSGGEEEKEREKEEENSLQKPPHRRIKERRGNRCVLLLWYKSQKECFMAQEKKADEGEKKPKKQRKKKKTITDVLATSKPKPGSPGDLQNLVLKYFKYERSVQIDLLKLLDRGILKGCREGKVKVGLF